jgi:ABC-type amino acid transport substrate-binding protein
MKPALVPLVATVALLSSIVTAARAGDLDAVQKRGVIRVIVAADEAAETYSLAASGEPGFERELMESFARGRGLTVEAVVSKTYPDRITMLVADKGDVIAAIFDTEDRRKTVDFTQEVMPTHNVAVTLRPAPMVASVKDLLTQRVGAIKGTKPAEAAIQEGVPAANLRTYDRLEDLFEALQRGEVTAVVLPISELAIARKRYQGLQAGANVGPSNSVAWAVRKEDGELKRALDEYLIEMRRSAVWSRLVVKYFGDEALHVLGRKRP